MNYTHDPEKQAINVGKHGVWFEAAESFDWEHAVIQVDSRRNYSETRFRAAGRIEGRVYMMVFCLRDTTVRIISLRKANNREVNIYESET